MNGDKSNKRKMEEIELEGKNGKKPKFESINDELFQKDPKVDSERNRLKLTNHYGKMANAEDPEGIQLCYFNIPSEYLKSSGKHLTSIVSLISNSLEQDSGIKIGSTTNVQASIQSTFFLKNKKTQEKRLFVGSSQREQNKNCVLSAFQPLRSTKTVHEMLKPFLRYEGYEPKLVHAFHGLDTKWQFDSVCSLVAVFQCKRKVPIKYRASKVTFYTNSEGKNSS